MEAFLLCPAGARHPDLRGAGSRAGQGVGGRNWKTHAIRLHMARRTGEKNLSKSDFP